MRNIPLTRRKSISSYLSYDYIVEKIASTYYATGRGLTSYSNADATVVINSAIGQLTTGGSILIKRGLYDNLSFLNITNHKVKIQGEGMYNTKLKFVEDGDVGMATWKGLISTEGYDYFSISDLELDGNAANQTLVGVNARMFGIQIGNSSNADSSVFARIQNCYIHDFTCNGTQSSRGAFGIIENCRVEDNGWNNISFGDYSYGWNVVDCQVKGADDVGISIGGNDNKIINCDVGDLYGTLGSGSTKWGIGIEGQIRSPLRNSIINCTVTGTNITRPIFVYSSGTRLSKNSRVINNHIFNTASGGVPIVVSENSSYTTIQGNKIEGANYRGIINSGSHTVMLNNEVYGSTNAGIVLQSTGKYNQVIGNVVYSLTAIDISSDSSFVTSNFLGATGSDKSIVNTGAGNVYGNNYGITKNQFVTEPTWQRETGKNYIAMTATSDGLTTGLIGSGSQNITVTSASANYILCLPSTSAANIGQVITGQVGANGFELRPIAAQAATVYINGVTTNVEAAIPANSSFEIKCINAVDWILKAWTALGAEITAIIPDAI
jgi:hypothetical protein